MNDFLKNHRYILIGILISLTLYGFLTQNPTPFDPDKPFIIDIWKDIFSWESFLKMKHNILDVQPVRDLYFWIVVNINDNAFIFLNALFWLFTIFNFSKIFNLGKRKEDLIVALVLGLHPVAIWSIMWPSAGKHLLSLSFISLSILYCFNIEEGLHLKGKKKALLFYILSIFTQPIFILFPIFIFYKLQRKWHKHKTFSFLLASFMIIGLFTNWYYYSFTYVEQTGTIKTMGFSEYSLAMNLLGFSRSIVQILLPYNMAFFYSPSSPLNLLGIPLLISLCALGFFLKKDKRAFQLFFFLMPLILIYFKATNIFVSDSYLLLPVLSLIPLLNAKRFKIATIGYAIFLCLFGLKEIKLLSTSGEKLEASYKREPNCKNGLLLSSQQLYNVDIKSFHYTISQVMKNKCIMRGVNATSVIMDLYVAGVFFNDARTSSEKLKLIGEIERETPLIQLIRDKLQGKERDTYQEYDIQKNLFNYIKKL